MVRSSRALKDSYAAAPRPERKRPAAPTLWAMRGECRTMSIPLVGVGAAVGWAGSVTVGFPKAVGAAG